MAASQTEPSDRVQTVDEADGEKDLQQFSCLYFGFASNLSPRSIQQRCPGALHVGFAVLKGWRFYISTLGFGNIQRGTDGDEVYGSLSFLTGRDEAALDKSEEVPTWHRKMKLTVKKLPEVKPGEQFDSAAPAGDMIEVTTYVDVERLAAGPISKEYIPFMRKAIADGLRCGVPDAYVDKYLAPCLPVDEGVGKEDLMMLRTNQFDQSDLHYVPRDLLDLIGRGKRAG